MHPPQRVRIELRWAESGDYVKDFNLKSLCQDAKCISMHALICQTFCRWYLQRTARMRRAAAFPHLTPRMVDLLHWNQRGLWEDKARWFRWVSFHLCLFQMKSVSSRRLQHPPGFKLLSTPGNVCSGSKLTPKPLSQNWLVLCCEENKCTRVPGLVFLRSGVDWAHPLQERFIWEVI